MKKIPLLLLVVPFIFLSGIGYAYVAHFLTRSRQPWYSLCMLGGLGLSIALLAWCTDTPTTYAAWTFAGAGAVYAGLCLLFGRGSATENIVPAHIMAILALMALPAYEQARRKASATHAISHYQTSTSSSSTAAVGTGLTKS